MSKECVSLVERFFLELIWFSSAIENRRAQGFVLIDRDNKTSPTSNGLSHFVFW